MNSGKRVRRAVMAVEVEAASKLAQLAVFALDRAWTGKPPIGYASQIKSRHAELQAIADELKIVAKHLEEEAKSV